MVQRKLPSFVALLPLRCAVPLHLAYQHPLTVDGRQLNALVDLASSPQGNQYSPQWEGPGPTKVLPWGQLAALDVLNAAVGFGDSFDVASR